MLYLETASESNSETGILSQGDSSSGVISDATTTLTPMESVESTATPQSSSNSASTSHGPIETDSSANLTTTEPSTTGPDTCGTEICDESPVCDIDCTPPLCGDGVVNTQANEECDDRGESAECDADCTLALCGDGVVNKQRNEECDDGGTAVCTDCTRTGLRVFVSSSKLPATLMGLSGANMECTTLADHFDPSSTKDYRAWLSQRVTVEDIVIDPSVDFAKCKLPLFLTNNIKIADSLQALMESGPQNPIDIDEMKQHVPAGRVWTRTNSQGVLMEEFLGFNVSDCEDWNANEDEDPAVVGITSLDPLPVDWFSIWTAYELQNCDQEAHLYCFEQCPKG